MWFGGLWAGHCVVLNRTHLEMEGWCEVRREADVCFSFRTRKWSRTEADLPPPHDTIYTTLILYFYVVDRNNGG